MADDFDEDRSEFSFERDNGPPEDEVEEQDPVKKKRGRKKVLPMWTGVVSFTHDNVDDIKLRIIGTDLLVAEGLPRGPVRPRDPPWKALFMGEDYLEIHYNNDMEQAKLSEERLLKLGEQVTKHRKWVWDAILKLERDQAEENKIELEKLSCTQMKIKHWQARTKKENLTYDRTHF